MVIWGHEGEVIISSRTSHKNTYSPPYAELKTILYALQIACRENLRVQHVESDSQATIIEIRIGSDSSFEWLSVVLDIDYYNALCGVEYIILTLLKEKGMSLRIALTNLIVCLTTFKCGNLVLLSVLKKRWFKIKLMAITLLLSLNP